MHRNSNKNRAAWLPALLACFFCCLAVGAASEDLRDDASLSAAVCPIVYQLDQSPSSRGYHYSFFGNVFFINEEGYLLTAAHVLETFRNGGRPYILVSRPNSPPQLLQATVIAIDSEHDVAILRANSNPSLPNTKSAFYLSPPSPLLPANPSSPSLSTRPSSKTPTPSKFLAKTASPAKSFLRIHAARKIRPLV